VTGTFFLNGLSGLHRIAPAFCRKIIVGIPSQSK